MQIYDSVWSTRHCVGASPEEVLRSQSPLGTMPTALVCHFGRECVCVSGWRMESHGNVANSSGCFPAQWLKGVSGERQKLAPPMQWFGNLDATIVGMITGIINNAGSSAATHCGNLCPMGSYLWPGSHTGWTHIPLGMYRVSGNTPRYWSCVFLQ